MLKTKFGILAISLAFAVGMASCSSQRPIVYPNEFSARASRAEADQVVDECMERAKHTASFDDYDANAAEEAGMRAGTSAMVGAAGGGAGGAVVGRAAEGAAVGAAGGAAASLMRSLLKAAFARRQPDYAYRSRVNHCLRERGYDPVGWR